MEEVGARTVAVGLAVEVLQWPVTDDEVIEVVNDEEDASSIVEEDVGVMDGVAGERPCDHETDTAEDRRVLDRVESGCEETMAEVDAVKEVMTEPARPDERTSGTVTGAVSVLCITVIESTPVVAASETPWVLVGSTGEVEPP